MAFDCGACGACCDLSRTPERWGFGIYVEVKDGDDVPENITCEQERDGGKIGRFMVFDDRKCVAHRGTPGCDSHCTIYDRRPAVCREMVPGDPLCLWARQEAGVAPVVPPGGFRSYVRGVFSRPQPNDACEAVLADIDEERREQLRAGALTTPVEDAALALLRNWGVDWIDWAKDQDPETHDDARRQRHARVAAWTENHGPAVVRGPMRRLRVRPKFMRLVREALDKALSQPTEVIDVGDAVASAAA